MYYLSNKVYRIKKKDEYSSLKYIYGISEGSIPGPSLLNIHLGDLFYFSEDLDNASFANDTAIYTAKISY